MVNIITQYRSPNYTPASQVQAVFGGPRTIDSQTIHWWGDPNSNPTFEGVCAWLCNPRAQASAHNVVTGTGNRVAVLVDYADAAWHAGNAVGNRSSVGHELDPRARDIDYQVAAENIAADWKELGRILQLRPHNSWTATQCPGVYDLNRLNAMALAIYNGSVKKTATAEEVRQAYLDILERPADEGGIKTYTTNGMSIGEVRNDLLNSSEYKKLQEKKAADYARNEWVRNLRPYTDGDSSYATTVKLVVVPAAGLLRYNLETGARYNDEVIPKDTVIDIVAKTSVGGTAYLISSYSKKNGQAVGLKATELGVPVVPPENEKPEWLENLQDIDDVEMYTRSDTPVLDIRNGDVTRTLPINTKVLITHATQIVGKDLLVLEGEKEVIETLYLNTKPVDNPDTDTPVIVDPPTQESAFVRFIKWVFNSISEFIKNFNNKKGN